MGLKLNAANGGGSVELDVPNTVNSPLALTVPATAGEVVVKATDGSVDLGDVNIDSSGVLLVDTSSASGYADRQLTVGDTSNASSNIEIRCATNGWGGLSFSDSTAADVNSYRGTIEYSHADNYMQFRTDGDAVMRIDSDGKLQLGDDQGTAQGELFQVIRNGTGQGTNDCLAYFETGQNDWIQKLYFNASGTAYFMDLQQEGTRRGRVFYDGTMNYTDGSDYRLKENIVPLANGIDRVKQLQPRTYNFIEHGPEKVYDGFLAHELAEVCPYAVKGEKDAVNEDGTPDIQMIDRSHVIPLLAAGLKEAIAKIETLETKVAALEATE